MLSSILSNVVLMSTVRVSACVLWWPFTSPNCPPEDKDGNTSLTLATLYCHTEVVKYLVAHGADVNHTSEHTDFASHHSQVLRSS